MAFPTVAATNSGSKTTPGTSHTVNLPSGIVADNLLIVLFATNGTGTVTFPSGWTGLVDQVTTLSGWYCRYVVKYRIADGTEGSTITVNTTDSVKSAHQSFRITDYSGTPAAAYYNYGGYRDSYPDPPNLSPGWGALDILWLATCGYGPNGYTYTISAYPTNYTDGMNTHASYDPGIGSARRNRNAASENPGTFTLTGDSTWVAVTIAVKPYIPPVAPTATTSAATNVEETTATGNGNITDNGGQNCDLRGFEWGTSSGNYPNSVTEGTLGNYQYGTGAYSLSLTGLPQGTKIYYRAKAHNSAGWGYGSELTFLTKPEAPTGLTVTEKTPISLSLSWTKGAGANRTMVRRKVGSYPTSRTDGDEAYFGTGSSVTDSGLTPNTTYYYRAWSEVTANALQQWSDAYAEVSETTPNLYKLEGYIGDVIDCTVDLKTYERLEWEEEIPTANEDITFQIRSSVDQVDWSDWQYIYSSPCTSFTIPIRRYVEWKAKLTTTDGYHSPKVKSHTFTWGKYT